MFSQAWVAFVLMCVSPESKSHENGTKTRAAQGKSFGIVSESATLKMLPMHQQGWKSVLFLNAAPFTRSQTSLQRLNDESCNGIAKRLDTNVLHRTIQVTQQ